jgi:hypothetical protein
VTHLPFPNRFVWGAATSSQEIPDPAARVTVDPDVRDRFGVPVARISGGIHPETRRTAEFIAEKAAEWALASGAVAAPSQVLAPHEGPSGGQHQAGTCRMGDDPATSVTDSWGRVWGHDNPALAHRVSRRIAEEHRARAGQQLAGASGAEVGAR